MVYILLCLHYWLDICVCLAHLSGDIILYVLSEMRVYKSLFFTLANSWSFFFQ